MAAGYARAFAVCVEHGCKPCVARHRELQFLAARARHGRSRHTLRKRAGATGACPDCAHPELDCSQITSVAELAGGSAACPGALGSSSSTSSGAGRCSSSSACCCRLPQQKHTFSRASRALKSPALTHRAHRSTRCSSSVSTRAARLCVGGGGSCSGAHAVSVRRSIRALTPAVRELTQPASSPGLTGSRAAATGFSCETMPSSSSSSRTITRARLCETLSPSARRARDSTGAGATQSAAVPQTAAQPRQKRSEPATATHRRAPAAQTPGRSALSNT